MLKKIKILLSRSMGCVTIDGVWICERIYWPLIHTTQNYNYSAVADLHTLHITTALAKPFSSLLCLHQPFSSDGFNSGDFSASRAQVLSSQHPVQNLPLNWQLQTDISCN
jgi:hypothetical protein